MHYNYKKRTYKCTYTKQLSQIYLDIHIYNCYVSKSKKESLQPIDKKYKRKNYNLNYNKKKYLQI